MGRLFWGIAAFSCSVLLSSCLHAPAQEGGAKAVPRLPQSESSPQSLRETLQFLGQMMRAEGLSSELTSFNRQAVTLCWQNPAWQQLRFKDDDRRTKTKIFLCNVPLQFRLCHTVKFLKIEKEFEKLRAKARTPEAQAKRRQDQELAFQKCDQDNQDYLVREYQLTGGSLNTITKGTLFELYRTILFDRDRPLPNEVDQVLTELDPVRWLQVSPPLLKQELDPRQGIRLLLQGHRLGIRDQDIVDIVLAVGGSKIKELL